MDNTEHEPCEKSDFPLAVGDEYRYHFCEQCIDEAHASCMEIFFDDSRNEFHPPKHEHQHSLVVCFLAHDRMTEARTEASSATLSPLRCACSTGMFGMAQHEPTGGLKP
jgi:hypothetical protein